MKTQAKTPNLAVDGSTKPLDIGSRRELMVDHYLIDQLEGAELRLSTPIERGKAFDFDLPHEGAFSLYLSIVTLPDGSFRAYYRGLPAVVDDDGATEVTVYAESVDGIHWTKPENNIVLLSSIGFRVTHNFTVFYDGKSGVPEDERWKGIGGLDKDGLIRFVSADGIVWRKFRGDERMLPPHEGSRYDSQNLAFWSEAEGLYICYFRTHKDIAGMKRLRGISRATSPDFINWTEEGEMKFRMTDGSEAPPEHLYTNQTGAYMRAPHIYVATAARFMPGRQVLTDEEAKEVDVDLGYFNDISDGIFMTSRGGTTYDRTFLEGFVRPGLGLGNWTSRTNYLAANVIQTGPEEMSFFVSRNYGQPNHFLSRFSLRLDGFASLHAGYAGGAMITKPFHFSGSKLEINFATSAAGDLRFELQNEAGQPLTGYALEDSREIIGDQISRIVLWNKGSDVADLAGQVVRLRVVLKDADLFAFQFR
jgi:hypothetical protein